MAKLSEVIETNPYPNADYLDIREAVGKKLNIINVFPFVSASKGPGVHILVELEDGKQYRLCTHAVSITDKLSRKEVLELLESGEYIECKIVVVNSQTNNGRKVFKLEDY